MNRFYPILFLSILFTSFASISSVQVSGTVFRDFNGNSTKDNSATFNENFIAGVIVKAFDANNVQMGPTKTTDASGVYSFSAAEIPAGTPVRIEFSGLEGGDYSTFSSNANGTNVQFANAPNTTTNYAINAPDDFWDNVNNPDPSLMVINLHRGLSNGAYQNRNTMLRINNSSSGPNVPTNSSQVTIDTGQTIAGRRTALHSQTGSIFGLAYQRSAQRYFATAELRRNSGFGCHISCKSY